MKYQPDQILSCNIVFFSPTINFAAIYHNEQPHPTHPSVRSPNPDSSLNIRFSAPQFFAKSSLGSCATLACSKMHIHDDTKIDGRGACAVLHIAE
jgi:hypothetical protein